MAIRQCMVDGRGQVLGGHLRPLDRGQFMLTRTQAQRLRGEDSPVGAEPGLSDQVRDLMPFENASIAANSSRRGLQSL